MTAIAVTRIQLYINSDNPDLNALLDEAFPRSIELAWRRLSLPDATLGEEVDKRMTADVGAAVANLDAFITFDSMDPDEWEVGTSGQHEHSKVVRARLTDGTIQTWTLALGGVSADVYARVEWVVVEAP